MNLYQLMVENEKLKIQFDNLRDRAYIQLRKELQEVADRGFRVEVHPPRFEITPDFPDFKSIVERKLDAYLQIDPKPNFHFILKAKNNGT